MAEHKRFSRDEVEFRKAQADDRPAIERIAAHTWDGEDYLPEVFEQWLQDDTGLFSVMTLQDEVVALGKLSKLGNDEWWLEGLRVDVRYQGRGLARIMHHYMVAQARHFADGLLRFATSSENKAVLHLAHESGFLEVGYFARYYLREMTPSQQGAWEQLSASRLVDTQAWLNQSPYFAAVQQSLEHRWKWYMMTPTLLEQRLVAGQVYAWQPTAEQWGGLAVLNTSNTTGHLTIAYADALADQRTQFWQAVHDLALSLSVVETHVKILDQPTYTTALDDTGWDNDEDLKAVLLSRDVVLTKETPVQYEQLPALD